MAVDRHRIPTGGEPPCNVGPDAPSPTDHKRYAGRRLHVDSCESPKYGRSGFFMGHLAGQAGAR